MIGRASRPTNILTSSQQASPIQSRLLSLNIFFIILHYLLYTRDYISFIPISSPMERSSLALALHFSLYS